MELIPFPVEWLNLPDEELCANIFLMWAKFIANGKGVDLESLTNELWIELFTQLQVASLGMDSDNAKNSDLEKVFRKICAEDYTGGAKVLRELMYAGGEQIKTDRLAAKGEKFKPNREKGALSARTKYIHELALDNPKLSAKELFALADRNIIGKMALRTFGNHVSAYRNSSTK
jgi:hypothetical protein